MGGTAIGTAPMTGVDRSIASRFDADTEVVPVGDGLRTVIADGWDIGGKPNGGYVLASLVRAELE